MFPFSIGRGRRTITKVNRRRYRREGESCKSNEKGTDMYTGGKNFFARDDRFRCCFCCHVRTGTIILGIWHLILHILTLGVLFGVLFHPETLSNQLPQWTSSDGSTTVPILGRAVNGIFTPDIYNPQLPELSAGPASNFSRGNLQFEDVHVGIIIILCTGTLTVLLLYGAIKGHPNYLMPFFCLQIFDFIISSLTAIGYFTYVPDVRRIIEDIPDVPFQKLLLCMDPQWLFVLVMLTFTLIIMLKAYFMGMVWSCHKYLKLLQLANTMDSFIEPDIEALLPPDYTTATKMPPHIPVCVPPPYTPPTANNQ